MPEPPKPDAEDNPDARVSAENREAAHLPYDERRQAIDRRGAGRKGKYDRRRNRCVHCLHFEGEIGNCAVHQTPVTEDTFACPAFESEPPPG